METNHGIGVAVDKPAIDPELAAMEAEMAANAVLERAEAKKSDPRSQPRPGRKSTRDRRSGGRKRTAKRNMARHDNAPDRASRPHARLGGAKLVKSEVQRASEERLAVRKYLSGVKVIRLIVECPEIKWVVSVPGIRNVWQLCQLPTESIRAITGLGPARRRNLRAYLISKNIPVAWEA